MGTPLLLHILVYRSDDKLRNPILSVICCFVFPCELRTKGMQNVIVTLPVCLSRGLMLVFYEISVAKEDNFV